MIICFWSENKHHERPIYLESSSGCKAELSGAFVNSRSWSFIRIQIQMPHYVLRIILLGNCISLSIFIFRIDTRGWLIVGMSYYLNLRIGTWQAWGCSQGIGMAKADSMASGVAYCLVICWISDFWMWRSSGMFGHVWMKKIWPKVQTSHSCYML